MDRIWQWTWDRFRARYSWAVYVVSFAELLPIYLFLSVLIVAFERSDRYVETVAITAPEGLVLAVADVEAEDLPGSVGGDAAGHDDGH